LIDADQADLARKPSADPALTQKSETAFRDPDDGTSSNRARPP
jgi:hypothetical protein